MIEVTLDAIFGELKRIADTLEGAFASAPTPAQEEVKTPKTNGSKPPETKKAKVKTTIGKISTQDLHKVLTKVVDHFDTVEEGRQAVIDILIKHGDGVRAMSKLDPGKFAGVFTAAQDVLDG